MSCATLGLWLPCTCDLRGGRIVPQLATLCCCLCRIVLQPPSPQTTRKNAGLSREDMMDVSLVPASAPSPTPAPRSPEPKAHQEPSSPSNYLARHARLPSPNKDLASTTIAAPASPVAIAGDAAVSPTTPSARPDDEGARLLCAAALQVSIARPQRAAGFSGSDL